MDLTFSTKALVPEFPAMRNLAKKRVIVDTANACSVPRYSITLNKHGDLQAAVSASARAFFTGPGVIDRLTLTERIVIVLVQSPQGVTFSGIVSDVLRVFGANTGVATDATQRSVALLLTKHHSKLKHLFFEIGHCHNSTWKGKTAHALITEFARDPEYHCDLWTRPTLTYKFNTPETLTSNFHTARALFEEFRTQDNPNATALNEMCRVVWCLELANLMRPEWIAAAPMPPPPSATEEQIKAVAIADDPSSWTPCETKPGWYVLTGRYSKPAAVAFYQACIAKNGTCALKLERDLVVITADVLDQADEFCEQAEKFLARGYKYSVKEKNLFPVNAAIVSKTSNWKPPNWGNLLKHLTPEQLGMVEEDNRRHKYLTQDAPKYRTSFLRNGESVCTISRAQAQARDLSIPLPDGI